MKLSMLFFVAGYFISQEISAQVINIPDKAKNHFAQKYPKAMDVEWKNNVANYTASFQGDSSKFFVQYSLNGDWSYTEQPRQITSLPQEVQASISKSRYSDWTIESGAYLENSKNEKLYRIEFKNGINKRYVFYDEGGKEVRSSITL